MLRTACLALTLTLLEACSSLVSQSQQLLTDSLAIPKEVEFRAMETYAGEVVCGEYSAFVSYHKPKQDFVPFLTVRGTLYKTPSSEQLAIYCSDTPAQRLLELTGVGPYTADNAPLAKITADFSALSQALERYYKDNFNYPTAAQGLPALVTATTVGRQPRRFPQGGYLAALPGDPWGRPYHYWEQQWGGTKGYYRLTTLGADGSEGGSGDNADVSTVILPYLEHIAHVLGQR